VGVGVGVCVGVGAVMRWGEVDRCDVMRSDGGCEGMELCRR
jgi:hypothetical protein